MRAHQSFFLGGLLACLFYGSLLVVAVGPGGWESVASGVFFGALLLGGFGLWVLGGFGRRKKEALR